MTKEETLHPETVSIDYEAELEKQRKTIKQYETELKKLYDFATDQVNLVNKLKSCLDTIDFIIKSVKQIYKGE